MERLRAESCMISACPSSSAAGPLIFLQRLDTAGHRTAAFEELQPTLPGRRERHIVYTYDSLYRLVGEEVTEHDWYQYAWRVAYQRDVRRRRQTCGARGVRVRCAWQSREDARAARQWHDADQLHGDLRVQRA